MLWSHILLVHTSFVICCHKDGNVACSRVRKETRGFGAREPTCSLPAHNLRHCIEGNNALILNNAQFHQRDA